MSGGHILVPLAERQAIRASRTGAGDGVAAF